MGDAPPGGRLTPGPVPFSLELLDAAGGVVVRGELDLGTVDRFDGALEQAERRGDDPLVVDLREVTFMDSSGLRSILEAYKRGLEADRRLVVVTPPGPVRRVLEITGAATLLDVVDAPPD